MRNKNLVKWVTYTVIVLLSIVFQGTPNFLPAIVGVYPLIIIPCVISVAVFEGDKAGVAFALLGGLLWDIESGKTFGFNALFLMILCIAASFLIQNLFRNTIVSATLFCVCATFIHQFITWFFFIYIAGSGMLFPSLLRFILPVTAYTLPFELLYYFLFRWLHRKFLNKDFDEVE